METPQNNNIRQMPLSSVVKEGVSQKDRKLEEVMEALFSMLPDDFSGYNFILKDGTKCWVKKFSAPKMRDDGQLSYGFDVNFSDGPLSHMEFFVKCTGWERSLVSDPDPAPTV